ncbi:hypothetical protein ALC60_00751 [Trachymyrmex zeteki]|uniref:Uncharacterized protein n=1 Tax=Mycetomoellerius zeteki TaxID=64791 RepID=A0A151XIW0_9HYME|nr:hypothetical protein ALC60_00751 [Trachymyrmex zeteki]
MNLDTDAIKSARKLISGIAINVSAVVIQSESRDQVSRDGNDLDQRSGIRHLIQRRENSFFSSRIKVRSPSGDFSLSEFARNILQIGGIRFVFDGASRGVANRNDEAKGEEREHVDVRDPDIPCRVDTARGRHVTPNIGRKPKLITTASILLEMPFYPGLTLRVTAKYRARACYRRRRCGPRSVLLTMRIDSRLISFALSCEVPASLLEKLGQRATASRRFRMVVWSEKGNKGPARAPFYLQPVDADRTSSNIDLSRETMSIDECD